MTNKGEEMAKDSAHTVGSCYDSTYVDGMWRKNSNHEEYRQFEIQSLYDYGRGRHHRSVI